MASISWIISDADHGQHFLTLNERCDTSVHALAIALGEAKSWIDKRILESKVYPSSPESIVAYMIDGEVVCRSCASNDEAQEARPDEVITVRAGYDLVFCDRCEKKVG